MVIILVIVVILIVVLHLVVLLFIVVIIIMPIPLTSLMSSRKPHVNRITGDRPHKNQLVPK